MPDTSKTVAEQDLLDTHEKLANLFYQYAPATVLTSQFIAVIITFTLYSQVDQSKLYIWLGSVTRSSLPQTPDQDGEHGMDQPLRPVDPVRRSELVDVIGVIRCHAASLCPITDHHHTGLYAGSLHPEQCHLAIRVLRLRRTQPARSIALVFAGG